MRDPERTVRAQRMRDEPTEPDRRMSRALRADRLGDVDLRRHKTIGADIADVAARNPTIVVGIDGDGHTTATGHDAARTRFAERAGYRAIRFMNRDVVGNREGVSPQPDHIIDRPPPPILFPEGKRAS